MGLSLSRIALRSPRPACPTPGSAASRGLSAGQRVGGLRFAADENLSGDLVRGLLRRAPALDLVRVQDAGLSGAEDPTVLAWAAREGRALLTHDVTTLTTHAYARVQAGQAMPGVVEISRAVPVGQAIEDLLLLAGASLEGEWEGHVLYLPLR